MIKRAFSWKRFSLQINFLIYNIEMKYTRNTIATDTEQAAAAASAHKI